MKTKKLRRRLRIFRWVQRALGLEQITRITMELKSYIRVSSTAMKEGAMPKGYVEDILVKQMAWEIIKQNLAPSEKGEVEDILDLETWRASVKIIVP